MTVWEDDMCDCSWSADVTQMLILLSVLLASCPNAVKCAQAAHAMETSSYTFRLDAPVKL